MANSFTLNFIDYKSHPALWAKRLKISQEAVEIYLDSDVIDPHTVTYLWPRILGYDMAKKHKPNPVMPFLSQVDFPRTLEAKMTGIVWDITTNPLRGKKNKLANTQNNIKRVIADINKYSDYFQHVTSYADYQSAREKNKLGCWISIQGGQAVDDDIDSLDKIPEVHRITLIHFTKSKIGASSFDIRNKDIGLSDFGKKFVEKMVEKKILVDLSHINQKGFFDALDVVPKDIPVLVTHTGVNGVFESWRNLTDEQIKAVAATGGTVGIIYYPKYLTKDSGKCTTDNIVDHMEHVIRVAGEDYVTLGSDYDGMITLPKDFKDITYQPVLVQKMLNRNWSPERIQKILGKNFLRVIKEYRP